MKQKGGLGTGSASILIVFVLLCLTTFATLSLVSAQADRKLSRRAADSMTAYYEADTRATELMAQLADSIGSVDPAVGRPRYFGQCAQRAIEQFSTLSAESLENGLRLHYETPIDDLRALAVSLDVLYPEQPGDRRLRIVAWRTYQTGDWEADDSIPLWPGN